MPRSIHTSTLEDAIKTVFENSQKLRAEWLAQVMFMALIKETGEVTICIEGDELSYQGELTLIAKSLRSLVKRRTKNGHRTHVRILLKSIASDIHALVNQAEALAFDRFGKIEAATVREIFTELTVENKESEIFLESFKDMFDNEEARGTFEYRGHRMSTAHEYLSISVDSREEPPMTIRIESRRRPGCGPFKASGTVILDGVATAFEADLGYEFSWRTGIIDPPAIHRQGFILKALARHAGTRAIIEEIARMPMPMPAEDSGPSVMQQVTDMYGGGYFNL